MDDKIEQQFVPLKEKMQEADLPELQIKAFKHYYKKLIEEGEEGGKIPEDEIEPINTIPKAKKLSDKYKEAGNNALDETVMIKLNGGLGTSMGLNKAKSLLKVKNGLSFLDIIIKQAIRDEIPLVLMNSFRTRKDCLEVMENYQEKLKNEIPADFVQHKVPKILKSDYSPATSEQNKEHEWCPPGHGDIYNSLYTSGMLNKLLGKGYKYAFISNSDNLGGVLNKRILGYIIKYDKPFLMEVAQRTPADKKGGHLARRKKDGKLVLREISQCPEDELEHFQDIRKYKYFNTNNLWINLEVLKSKLDKSEQGMILPLICNEKHLNPRDYSTPKVFQLETAMGAAISSFEGAGAIEVSENRFIPVKKTNSLLNVRSDNYILSDDCEIKKNPERDHEENCQIDLDKEYYKFIDQMEERFPEGPPSLLDCSSFKVQGDVLFGNNIQCIGEVEVINDSKVQKKIKNITLENEKNNLGGK